MKPYNDLLRKHSALTDTHVIGIYLETASHLNTMVNIPLDKSLDLSHVAIPAS